MISRIEILSKFSDTRGRVQKNKLISLGYDGKINDVKLIDVYTISKRFNSQQLKKIANSLSNPVNQIAYINQPVKSFRFNWAIETGYLPGVTDNIANTTKEIIEDLLKIKFDQNEGVYTSQVLLISGKLSKEDIKIISESLINPLIQRIYTKTFTQYKSDKGMGKIAPLVKLIIKPKSDIVNLNVTDDELIKIGKSGIANTDGTRRGPLALDLIYMKTIQKYFSDLGHNPTDIELESIAQTWSEHCKHTIFADPIDEIKDGLFNTYIKNATVEIRKRKGKKSHPVPTSVGTSRDRDNCVSVFTDNSGAIEFDNKYLITHKVETHNSPSALDPFGGAITGICGVNRDAIGFGLGAKPVANYYGYCFADPNDKSPLYKGANLTQKMLEPKRIMLGVIDGVNSGGNCSGIPTPQGFLVFDNRYKGKPLVFVGTVGLIPKKISKKNVGQRPIVLWTKKAKPNDYIVMIGGRVGQDGIHGATFSSEAMDSGSPATAVQIGDPITQKKLSDAIVKEARDLNLYNSITDNGAGGLSCSVAEMAKESGGCLVDLDKVPLKYPNLEPWKIWVSESQERMTLAVPKNKWKKFYDLMKRRGVEATIIGTFTQTGKCIVKYDRKTIVNIDMKFLHDGLPPKPKTTVEIKLEFEELKFIQPSDLTNILKKILSNLNICGYEFISKQYDHEVQGGSVIKPLQGRGRINGEASVVRPVLNSNKGIVLSQGILPQYSDIDIYHMAASVIDTAIRNAVAIGANPDTLALLDNFCWCSSNEPERLYQLKRATQACYDYALAYQTPFISGKDSMFNDFKGYDEKGNPVKISVPPTLLVSSIGVIDNILKTVSIDLKFPGDLIYILGDTFDELGGSEYYSMYRYIGNNVPKVNALKNKKIYQFFYKSVQKDLISSSIAVNRGGISVALIKTAMSGMLGINVSLKSVPGKVTRDDFTLFSESQGRIIVSINPKKQKQFEKLINKIPYKKIGIVTDKDKIIINGFKGNKIIDIDLQSALKSYKKTFKDY